MDSARFDALSRSLTDGSSRRGLLAFVASGLLAALPFGSLGEVVAAKKKKGKGKKKKEKTYARTNGQGCGTRKDCASALCGSGICLACSLDADCGSDGCFCAQPAQGGSKVCVAIQETLGAVSTCDVCPKGTICRDANPGTFDCFKRCGA